MRVAGNEEGLARLDAVGEWVRDTAAPMSAVQLARGMQAVANRLEARRRRSTPVIVASFLGAAVVAALLALALRPGARGFQLGGALAYRIEGGEIGDGGYIHSLDPAGTALRFSEGTELRLRAGARGRLSSVDRRGARLAIEEGEADVKVTPRPGARWLVDAGPFLITVKGTIFTAAWNGATERLDIRMKRGLVSVSGPLADGVLAVRAGQHLSVNVRKKEVVLRELAPAELAAGEGLPGAPGSPDGPALARPAAVEPAPEGPEADAGEVAGEDEADLDDAFAGTTAPFSSDGGRDVRAPRRRAALTTGSGRWAAALTAGNLDLVLEEAEQRGLRRSLARSSREDLAALADAARYRRRNNIARRALLAERQRFPHSPRGIESAFLLGRLEESKVDGGERALEWYDRYLKEAPSGAYSSEALGRKMVATERLRGASDARLLAEDYVRRFPGGTYARIARALLDAP